MPGSVVWMVRGRSARWRLLLSSLRVGRLTPLDRTEAAVTLLWAAAGALPAWAGMPAPPRPTARQLAWARREMARAAAAQAAWEAALLAQGWTLYRRT